MRDLRVILRAELKLKWSDFWFERADLRSEMVEFGLSLTSLI